MRSLPGSCRLSCLSPNRQTENRRITHISAEQKRRFNIKLGFDTLHGLVSTLSTQPNLKVSAQAPQPHVDPLPPTQDQTPRQSTHPLASTLPSASPRGPSTQGRPGWCCCR